MGRIETARRSHRTLLAGEYDSALYTSDLVYDQHFGNTGGRYQGEAGMLRWIGQLYEIWSEGRGVLEDPREIGDAVVARFRVDVRGGQTDIEVELRGSVLYRFAPDGRIARIDVYNELEAAGEALTPDTP